MAKITVEVEGKNDGATGVLNSTASAADNLNDAVARLIKQEQQAAAMKAAEEKFKRMTAEQKKAALAAHELGEAQRKAAGDAEQAAERAAAAARKQADAEEEAAKQARSLSGRFTEIKAGIDLVVDAVQTLDMAVDTVMALGKEGAELDYTADKFERLSRSVGKTSDALLGDLRTATKGLVSDSELIGSATDFMSLGLAKTADEAVRLTRIAGALGMDMNQLVLTLTNQTTMRFDALGVSVDGFEEKVNALKASGMSASDAFNEAFLRQAEEQIGRLGDRADNAAASFDRLEVAQKNFEDSQKRLLGSALGPMAGALADISNKSADHGTTLLRVIPVVGGLEVVYSAATAAIDNFKSSQTTSNDEMEASAQAATEAALAADHWKSVADTSAQEAERWNRQLAQTNGELTVNEDKVQAAIRASDGYQAALERMQNAQAKYNETLQNFNENYGDKVVNKLEAAGLKGADYERALGMVDNKLGTTFLAQDKANKALDAAIENYKKTGDIDAFSDALDDNKTMWKALDDNVQKAKQGFQDAQAAFDSFLANISAANGMKVVIDVKTSSSGGGGGVPNSQKRTPTGDLKNPGGGKPRSEERAMGGPVYAGRLYLVGERGPELFAADRDGHVTSANQTAALLHNLQTLVGLLSGGGMQRGDVYIQKGAIQTMFADEQELFLRFAEYLQSRR
jgi:hypothetical protein